MLNVHNIQYIHGFGWSEEQSEATRTFNICYQLLQNGKKENMYPLVYESVSYWTTMRETTCGLFDRVVVQSRVYTIFVVSGWK